mmetsp:Transcript_16991/g.50843  ORF Transcript_16991/g.50843 Transcript_16991/m.50843 type:complete len:261 (+) Transcript_16991:251-1033(+)
MTCVQVIPSQTGSLRRDPARSPSRCCDPEACSVGPLPPQRDPKPWKSMPTRARQKDPMPPWRSKPRRARQKDCRHWPSCAPTRVRSAVVLQVQRRCCCCCCCCCCICCLWCSCYCSRMRTHRSYTSGPVDDWTLRRGCVQRWAPVGAERAQCVPRLRLVGLAEGQIGVWNDHVRLRSVCRGCCCVPGVQRPTSRAGQCAWPLPGVVQWRRAPVRSGRSQSGLVDAAVHWSCRRNPCPAGDAARRLHAEPWSDSRAGPTCA